MTLLTHAGTEILTREQLVTILPPEGTDTFRPIKHATLVDEVHEALARRQLSVIKDEYVVSDDGMKLFGNLDLTTPRMTSVSPSASEMPTTSPCASAWYPASRSLFVQKWPSTASFSPSKPSTLRSSRLWIQSRSALTESSAISNPSPNRWNAGNSINLPTTAQKPSSLTHSSARNSTPRNILRSSFPCTTSSRNTLSLSRARHGASRTPSLVDRKSVV